MTESSKSAPQTAQISTLNPNNSVGLVTSICGYLVDKVTSARTWLLGGASSSDNSKRPTSSVRQVKHKRPRALKPGETLEQAAERRRRRKERKLAEEQHRSHLTSRGTTANTAHTDDSTRAVINASIYPTKRDIPVHKPAFPSTPQPVVRSRKVSDQRQLQARLAKTMDLDSQMNGLSLRFDGALSKASPTARDALQNRTRGFDRRSLRDADAVLNRLRPHDARINKGGVAANIPGRLSRYPTTMKLQSPAQASPLTGFRSPGVTYRPPTAGYNPFKTKNASNKLKPLPPGRTIEQLLDSLQQQHQDKYEWNRIRQEQAARDKAIEARRVAEEAKKQAARRVRRSIPEEVELRARHLLETNLRHMDASDDDVVAEGFNLSITVHDIFTLRPGQWLNDEVINFWLNLIKQRSDDALDASSPRHKDAVARAVAGRLPADKTGPLKVHCFNTFFYPSLSKSGYSGVKRWARKAKVEIGRCDVVLVPVHLGVHWCMAAINLRRRRFEYWDSLHGSPGNIFSRLREYLAGEWPNFQADEAAHGRFTDFAASKSYHPGDAANLHDPVTHRTGNLPTSGKVRDGTHAPSQRNGYDCGVFASRMAECIARGVDPDFDQADCEDLRLRMAASILDGSIY
ncbi:SUMO1 sentrin specific peptidase 1 [Savitreella phatthalungensis]